MTGPSLPAEYSLVGLTDPKWAARLAAEAATATGADFAVTFAGEAMEAAIAAVAHLPAGYTVALLEPGMRLPEESDVVSGVDVAFIKAGLDGVTYRYLDSETCKATGPEHIKPWTDIARVHVY